MNSIEQYETQSQVTVSRQHIEWKNNSPLKVHLNSFPKIFTKQFVLAELRE